MLRLSQLGVGQFFLKNTKRQTPKFFLQTAKRHPKLTPKRQMPHVNVIASIPITI